MEPGKFPGPLYPPDAAGYGKTPSRDSPFVLAVKRWAAHVGAWPWDPDGWDDSYSNGFAHGRGDPQHAGVAAIQRWAKISPAHGWFGEPTFNFARSVLIPQGRTHAGEPAWDQICIELTAQAYELEHPSPRGSTIRERALELAIAELGVSESPAGSNRNPYGAWYGEDGVPWCSIFTSWCYWHAGSQTTFQTVKQAGADDRYDYVPHVVADARGGRFGLSVTGTPLPGDLVCFDWEGNGEYDHVGLFEEWTGGRTFASIEGNTSTSDNSNGGQVMRRQRDVNGQGTVFVRVAE